MWELDCEESWALKNWRFWTVEKTLEKTLGVPWTARRSNQFMLKEIILGVLWKDWCWSWNSNTLATSCEDLTHWKRLWCWEGLGAGGEGDGRWWDVWMSSPTRCTWVCVNSGSGDGQGGLLCCNSWDRRATQLNWEGGRDRDSYMMTDRNLSDIFEDAGKIHRPRYRWLLWSVTQSCLTLYDPMVFSPSGSSIHGIF